MLRINLIFYGAHTPEIDARILGILPTYVIINPPHGLGARFPETTCSPAMAAYQPRG